MSMNGWGFVASRPGGNGTGVMTSTVLSDQRQQEPASKQAADNGAAMREEPSGHKARAGEKQPEMEITKDRLLFVKTFLEAALANVETELSRFE